MFIGFIKAVGLFAVLGGGGFALYYFVHPFAAPGGHLLGRRALHFMTTAPSATVWGARCWRGIHFGYRGELGALYKQCLPMA